MTFSVETYFLLRFCGFSFIPFFHRCFGEIGSEDRHTYNRWIWNLSGPMSCKQHNWRHFSNHWMQSKSMKCVVYNKFYNCFLMRNIGLSGMNLSAKSVFFSFFPIFRHVSGIPVLDCSSYPLFFLARSLSCHSKWRKYKTTQKGLPWTKIWRRQVSKE